MEELKKEAKDIQDYLEITCSDNPEEMVERIKDLSVYMARSGEMLAKAKYLYNQRTTAEITKTIIAIAKAIAQEEQYLVDWLERINRCCTHQIEALRSLLSYEKENLRITKTGY